MHNTGSKVKRKFNIIDALIIILVLLGIVAVIFRSQISGWIGAESDLSEYRLTFKISKIKDSSAAMFKTQDELYRKVYLDSPKLMLGVVNENLDITPAKEYITDSQGKIEEIIYPSGTYVDVAGTMTCSGYYRNGEGFYLDGNYLISPGEAINVHTIYLDFVITVINIEPYTK